MEFLDPVARAQRIAHGGGGIGEPDKLKAVAVFPEVEGVLRLPHQSRADQSHPQPLHASPFFRRARSERADEIFQLSVLLIGTFQFSAWKHRRRGGVKPSSIVAA